MLPDKKELGQAIQRVFKGATTTRDGKAVALKLEPKKALPLLVDAYAADVNDKFSALIEGLQLDAAMLQLKHKVARDAKEHGTLKPKSWFASAYVLYDEAATRAFGETLERRRAELERVEAMMKTAAAERYQIDLGNAAKAAVARVAAWEARRPKRVPFGKISSVEEGSPAHAAGLRAGDEWLEFGGVWVDESGLGVGYPNFRARDGGVEYEHVWREPEGCGDRKAYPGQACERYDRVSEKPHHKRAAGRAIILYVKFLWDSEPSIPVVVRRGAEEFSTTMGCKATRKFGSTTEHLPHPSDFPDSPHYDAHPQTPDGAFARVDGSDENFLLPAPEKEYPPRRRSLQVSAVAPAEYPRPRRDVAATPPPRNLPAGTGPSREALRRNIPRPSRRRRRRTTLRRRRRRTTRRPPRPPRRRQPRFASPAGRPTSPTPATRPSSPRRRTTTRRRARSRGSPTPRARSRASSRRPRRWSSRRRFAREIRPPPSSRRSTETSGRSRVTRAGSSARPRGRTAPS